MRAQPGHAERGSGRPARWYFPGRSPGQPYKANQYRICYHISKTYGKNTGITGDRLDYFLSEADRKINYYESQIGRSNPYNPHRMLAEFNIQVLDDYAFTQLKNKMKDEFDVKADEVLVMEGCENDDFNILGGKHAFLSHFCNFFNFNICYSAVEQSANKEIHKFFNDGDRVNSSIESFINDLDKI